MHPTSLENMQRCYDRFIRPAGYELRQAVQVLDVGGAEVNGTYRAIFSAPAFTYLTADIVPEGVDIPLSDPYRIPLPDESVDILVSGQMLEHCEYFWQSFCEMVRLMKPDGCLLLIAPSAGPIHRYPVDCYRFYPDAYAALARFAHCRLEAVWRDPRGPWQDLVGVFRKSPLPAGAVFPPPGALANWDPARALDPAAEVQAGASDYLTVLAQAHAVLAPGGYLEIGVRHGRSLALARCPALGIDPAPDIDRPLGATTRLVAQTSDDYFDLGQGPAPGVDLDLAFIDGMHLFEYVLRDFMHVEHLSHPATLVAIDDVFPVHPLQGRRERQTRVWTGDVWKILPCLIEQRPDLFLMPLDTWPTGTLLVVGLDISNRVFWEGYNPLVKAYRDRLGEEPPPDILQRQGAVDPGSPLVSALFRLLRDLRGQDLAPQQVVRECRALATAHGVGGFQ